MTRWTALLRDGDATCAIALNGAQVLRTARGADAQAARKTLDHDAAHVVHLGDGVPDALPALVLPTRGTGLPGLTQTSPADVIDAQVRLWLAGFLARNSGWDGVAWVIGPQVSHWVHLSAGEAVSCLSTLTPRLRMALEADMPPDDQAIADTLSRPEALAMQLRRAQITGQPGALSGHLLGAELAAARPWWLGQPVALIAPPALVSAHAAGLRAQGVPVSQADPDTLLPAGLAALAGPLGLTG